MDPAKISETRIAEMVAGVAKYFRTEREVYFRESEPLAREWKTAVQAYFPKALLEKVRTVVLKGVRIPSPPFYAEAMALSSGNFPDFVHLASVTYVDILVFHEQIEVRALFHALVHAAQIECLGFERYTDLYLRGFVRTRSWLTISLEAQAYQLDTQFAKSDGQPFSVEEEIKAWTDQGKY